jgi:hypothetical protein
MAPGLHNKDQWLSSGAQHADALPGRYYLTSPPTRHSMARDNKDRGFHLANPAPTCRCSARRHYPPSPISAFNGSCRATDLWSFVWRILVEHADGLPKVLPTFSNSAFNGSGSRIRGLRLACSAEYADGLPEGTTLPSSNRHSMAPEWRQSKVDQ